MPRFDDVTAALNAIDTATTDLGTRVQALIDDINATASDGLNGPQTENVLARLAPIAATLNAMGHNPNNPVPPAPPEDPEMPGPLA